MRVFGDVIQEVGLAAFIGGYGAWSATLLARIIFGLLTMGRRGVSVDTRTLVIMRTLVIGFYARAVGTVGIMAMLMAPIVRGEASWLWLVVIFVVGGPALALLLVRPVTASNPLGLTTQRGRRPH